MDKKRLKQIILNNIGIKIAAVFLAFVMWVNVVGGQMGERVFTIDINYEQIPENLWLARGTTTEVTINVRGPRQILNSITSDIFKLNVDLLSNMASAGKNTFYISTDMFIKPASTDIIKTDPSQIDVYLEERREKELNIFPVYAGNLREDYEIRGVKVFPPKVRVLGSASQLEGLESITTEDINIDNKDASFVQNVSLKVPSNLIKLTEITEVAVEFDIRPRNIVREFEGVPVRAVNVKPGENVRIRPDTVRVVLSGSPHAIEQLSRNFTVEVDGSSDIESRIREVKSPIDSEEITVLSVEPQTVLITID